MKIEILYFLGEELCYVSKTIREQAGEGHAIAYGEFTAGTSQLHVEFFMYCIVLYWVFFVRKFFSPLNTH